MELDIIAAKDFIAGKFRNAGDFGNGEFKE